MQKLSFLIIFLLTVLLSEAQNLTVVKGVELLPTNVLAARNQRSDDSGTPGALILVNSTIPTLRFSGNVIGEVSYTNTVYSVYLKSRSNSLAITNGNGESIKVKFDKLESKRTYEMTVGLTEETGYLKCTTVPSGADITLTNGVETVNLGRTPIESNVKVSVGTYNIIIKKKGYQDIVKDKVKIKKDEVTKLHFKLK